MLSRSSSAYQPLDPDEGDNNKKHSGGGSHEMTSITVISNPLPPPQQQQKKAVQAPFNSSNTCNVLDFSLCATSAEKTQWTNFHFIMCIGIGGFFVFWVVLLMRMYLPVEYRFWT